MYTLMYTLTYKQARAKPQGSYNEQRTTEKKHESPLGRLGYHTPVLATRRSLVAATWTHFSRDPLVIRYMPVPVTVKFKKWCLEFAPDAASKALGIG